MEVSVLLGEKFRNCPISVKLLTCYREPRAALLNEFRRRLTSFTEGTIHAMGLVFCSVPRDKYLSSSLFGGPTIKSFLSGRFVTVGPGQQVTTRDPLLLRKSDSRVRR